MCFTKVAGRQKAGFAIHLWVCRIAKAVTSAEANQATANEALQKSASLQGKVEVLQRALQKAEERAANLEFQVQFWHNSSSRYRLGLRAVEDQASTPLTGHRLASYKSMRIMCLIAQWLFQVSIVGFLPTKCFTHNSASDTGSYCTLSQDQYWVSYAVESIGCMLQNSARSGQTARQTPVPISADTEAGGGKLEGEVQLLKEQLMSAYEKAAEATSRIAQYQALAESSNQALEAMQVGSFPLSARYRQALLT